MGDTNISGLGKILSGNEMPVSVNQLRKEDVKVEFSEIMTQSSLKELYTQISSEDTEIPVQRRAESSLETPPSADYEKFQYKDNKIPEKTECNDVAVKSEVKEKMTEFSGEVKEVLKEELGVSEEEITSAMETLGLSYADLLNQNNLANLVAELTGSNDVCGLLCNEQFLNVLHEVNALSQELLQNLDMSMEELVAFLDAQGLVAVTDETVTEVNADAVLHSDTALAEETTGNYAVTAEDKFTSDEKVLMSVEETTEDVTATDTFVNDVAGTGNTSEKTTEDATATDTFVNDVAGTGIASEETTVQTGKTTADGTVTAEDAVNDEVPIEVITTEDVKQQSEESSDELLQQGEQNQKTDTEEVTENGTQKLSFRQTVKESGTQVSEGIQVNQNANVEQMNSSEVVQNVPETMNMREIMNQLVDAARATVSTDMTKMEMQLNPENLGKMYLEIVQKDGVVSAKIQLQNEAVKEAVEAQIVELRHNLNQAGVKVDAVEVTVASHEFERNLEQDAKQEERQAGEQEKASKQRRINLNNLDELSGVMTEEETLVAKMMAEQGNSIDFTA